MAVEIFILSGSRRGERLVLDIEQFRAGASLGCEVYFDPQRDPPAQYREAMFRLEGDGWYVHRTGNGEILVNHDVVRGHHRLRSGDVVRMSELGPEFSLAFVARPSGLAAEPVVGGSPWSAPVAAPVASRIPEPVLPLPPALPVASEPTVPFGQSFPASAVSASPAVPIAEPVVAAGRAQPSQGMGEAGRMLLLIGGGAGICVACLIAAKFLLTPAVSPQTPVVAVAPPSDSVAKPAGGSTQAGSQTEAKTEKDEKKTSVTKTSGPDWPALVAQLKGAVLLIQVELGAPAGASAWPHATCCAVGEHTLLTSASMGLDLAKFREDGFKVWAVDPEAGTRLEVREIRVRRDFGAMPDKSVEQKSVNLAFLEVEGKLTKTVRLATAKELGELEEGLPIACVGFSHQATKITRHDRFEPRLTMGKVFLVESPPPQSADGPRTADLLASMPANAYGSPFVDSQGRLLAVYLAPASDAEAKGLKDLHFAAVASTRLIDAWLRDRDENGWVLATSSGTTSTPPKSR
jgi:hypothetical protein